MNRKFNHWNTHDAARNRPHSSHFASLTIKRRKRIVITRNVMSKVSDRRQMTSPWTQIRQSIISSFLSSPRCCGLRSGFGQDLQWQLITILLNPHPPPSSFPPFFHYPPLPSLPPSYHHLISPPRPYPTTPPLKPNKSPEYFPLQRANEGYCRVQPGCIGTASSPIPQFCLLTPPYVRRIGKVRHRV
jgi:hypothetical protein